ncbi:citrate lyase subunit beta/citryl-CoA lyase [Virgibacillus halotolerans]|uniref:HpcH/HpaI aldolase/citrate lyase family protein n=1 Tax=Virgibacillus halotolerans TaxID=1071053 RepID=UPI001961BAD0|nr:CoA ester lyase [Virgibacillus halotolerans]MBM7599462.1 citrate lyase subunit beta/citryl-CoA lyase [Virgibacillus halotolerans]
MRSWLFVPGSNKRALERSLTLEADMIIYDLEDAISINEKQKARTLVKDILERSKKVNYVRINRLSTLAYEDVEEIVQKGIAGVVLPKAETREDILVLDHQLSHWEQKRHIPAGSVRIVPLIESALGLYHSVEIAQASPRVNQLMFGAVDFTLDINTQMSESGEEIIYARSQLVIASRVAGIEAPIDTVYTDIHNSEGLLADTQLAKQLGFQGKLIIHPGQISDVNRVFTPDEKEIEEAQGILNANEQAERDGLGAFQLNGKMIDFPVVERARKIIKKYNKFVIEHNT